MKRYSNTHLILLISLMLFTWLGVACAPEMQSTEVVTPMTQTMDTATETPAVVVLAPEIVGRWRAVIEMPDGGGNLEIIMNITQSDNGSLNTYMDVPLMGVTDIPITFSYDNGEVKWTVPENGTDFNGRLIDSSTLEGTVTNPMGGPPETITFKRVE